MIGNFESLERVFFAYILENPNYFHRVEPIAFKDPNIQFVYVRVRNYFVGSKRPLVPSNAKIRELIRMDDPSATKVSDEYITGLLSVDVGEYEQGKDDDWLRKNVQSWCTTSNLHLRVMEAADEIRSLDPTEHDHVEKVTIKVRELFANTNLLSYEDEDLGLDFDDAASHIQDNKANKLPSGWNTLDELMAGGWDRKTLNVVIGPSNSGKSIWLTNIGVNTANSGKNVLYVSLEMSEKKVMKRIGASRLRININEYDSKSKDVRFMESKIKDMRVRSANFMADGDLFENPHGKIYVKEFPAGSATVADVDNHIKRLQEAKNIRIDMVIVDYLTIMSPDKKENGSLFTNGKQLSEGLRAIAQKYDLCMVTAMQVGKDNFGASDINLSDISESKAIVETADTMYGIIRTDAMRAEGKYILKLLKLRDGDFRWTKTHFELNKDFLSLENDKRLDYM